MTSTERARKRINNLRAAGQCVRCRIQLPPGDKRWRCTSCVKANRPDGRKSYETAKAAGLCPACRKPHVDPAYVTCPSCRETAKRRFRAQAPRKSPPNESAKWSALDASMAFACERCGLRGDHVCVEGATSIASSRPGGSTFPAPGGITLSPSERRAIAKIGASKFSPRALQYKRRWP